VKKTRFAKIANKHFQTFYAQKIANQSIGPALTGRVTAKGAPGNGWADMHEQLLCKEQPPAGKCLDSGRGPA